MRNPNPVCCLIQFQGNPCTKSSLRYQPIMRGSRCQVDTILICLQLLKEKKDERIGFNCDCGRNSNPWLLLDLICGEIRFQGNSHTKSCVRRPMASTRIVSSARAASGKCTKRICGIRALPNPEPVAVKKLNPVAEQSRKNYVSEIMILGLLNHRNRPREARRLVRRRRRQTAARVRAGEEQERRRAPPRARSAAGVAGEVQQDRAWRRPRRRSPPVCRKQFTYEC
jgi:hypothetical protein